jgi:hypothetical protein
MRENLPIGAVLADIEQQIADGEQQQSFHAAQESFHAEQQAFHREQQEILAADLEKLRQRRETFREAAESVRESAGRRAPAAPRKPRRLPPEEAESYFYPSGGLRWTTLIRRLVEDRSPEEVFGRTEIARAIRVALGGKMRRPDLDKVSMVLLRLAAEGSLQVVRKGSYQNEALYRRA